MKHEPEQILGVRRELADQILRHMVGEKLTQTQVAGMTKLSRCTVNMNLSVNSRGSLTTLVRIADRLGVPYQLDCGSIGEDLAVPQREHQRLNNY